MAKIVARRIAIQPAERQLPDECKPTGCYTHADVNAVLWFDREPGHRIECMIFRGCRRQAHRSRFVCECGHQWSARAYDLVVRKFGCSKCYHQRTSERMRLSIDEINARPLMVERGYKCLSAEARRPKFRKFKCSFGFTFEGRLGDVLRGHKNCPCKKCKALRSQKQSLEEVSLRLAPLQLECTEYNGCGGEAPKSWFKCLVCSHPFDAYAGHVLRGLSGCSGCRPSKAAERSRQEVIKALVEQGFGIVLVNYGGTQKALSVFSCCGQQWTDFARNVLRRKTGCRHVAGNSPLTVDIVNARLKEKGREIVCIAYGGTSAAFSDFECQVCWCIWEQTAYHVLNDGSGCPSCNPGGFDYTAPAIFYVLLGTDGRINVGVTADHLVRIPEHENDDAIPYRALILQPFQLGAFAVVAEDMFKHFAKTLGVATIPGATEKYRMRTSVAVEVATAAIERGLLAQSVAMATLSDRPQSHRASSKPVSHAQESRRRSRPSSVASQPAYV